MKSRRHALARLYGPSALRAIVSFPMPLGSPFHFAFGEVGLSCPSDQVDLCQVCLSPQVSGLLRSSLRLCRHTPACTSPHDTGTGKGSGSVHSVERWQLAGRPGITECTTAALTVGKRHGYVKCVQLPRFAGSFLKPERPERQAILLRMYRHFGVANRCTTPSRTSRSSSRSSGASASGISRPTRPPRIYLQRGDIRVN